MTDGAQQVRAIDLEPGDHIHLTRENGKAFAGTAQVHWTRHDDTTTWVRIWTGELTYGNRELVTIDACGEQP